MVLLELKSDFFECGHQSRTGRDNPTIQKLGTRLFYDVQLSEMVKAENKKIKVLKRKLCRYNTYKSMLLCWFPISLLRVVGCTVFILYLHITLFIRTCTKIVIFYELGMFIDRNCTDVKKLIV